jgi:hypothetical protein
MEAMGNLSVLTALVVLLGTARARESQKPIKPREDILLRVVP